jgi:hypothetical protein
MVVPIVFALVLAGARVQADAAAVSSVEQPAPVQAGGQETVADIQIHGNVLTPDDEMARAAGIRVGMPVTPDTPAEIAARLRATGRFERVEVLKRFASIADPTRIVLVVIVDEGPVKIEAGADAGTPPRVVRDRGLHLMFLPLLKFEDGYGLSYGARIARRNPLGRRSELSFPLTWGGDKRAAAVLARSFARGPVSRFEAGGSVSRRRHPFFDANDNRERVWLTVQRDVGWVPGLRTSATAGWQHVALLDRHDGMIQTGADLTFDTRLDPLFPRNAVFARAAWERTAVQGPDGGAVNQSTLDGRGYLGLAGQSVVAVRALRQDADASVPPYLQPMMGGPSNLRGFRTGTAVGDTLVAGSIELRVPLTSPLSVGKIGVTAFADVAKTYSKGERFGARTFERGVGGGVWFSAAFLRLNIDVAHGIGGSTRVQVGTTIFE